MEKINLVELLKDCPSGMKLECASYDNVSFDKISDDKKATYPIFCYITDKEGNRSSISFTENGCESKRYGAKCVIFPKGKTTWEGFQRPFKDGDIIAGGHGNIAIYKEPMWYNKKFAGYHCGYRKSDNKFLSESKKDGHFGLIEELHFATEVEKQKLFEVIKENGYKWDEKTKTLEKLIKPKFKVGDIIKSKNCPIAGNFVIVGIEEDNYSINLKNYCIKFKDQDNYELINKPKFKVGDRIRHKIVNFIHVITGIKDEYYIINEVSFPHGILPIEAQDEYELVPDKFDVTTLKPYDKVLARCSSLEKWRIQLFEKFDKTCKFPFICMGYNKYKQCIPYEGNEHLLDTADSCSDYYLI